MHRQPFPSISSVFHKRNDIGRTLARNIGVDRYFNRPSELSEFLELGLVVRDVATRHGLVSHH